MAVRCGTCGLVAYYTPDRCPRCGGESFDEVAGRPRRPIPSSGESFIGFVLFVAAPFCALAGILMLTADEPGSVRFLGLMVGVGLGALCGGMAALLLRHPAP